MKLTYQEMKCYMLIGCKTVSDIKVVQRMLSKQKN